MSAVIVDLGRMAREESERERLRYVVVCDTSDEAKWLAARNTGIGASEIAILLGASEWGSNVEMFYRKIGELDEPLREQTEEMELGQRFEAIARDEVARRAGVTLQAQPSKLLRSTEHPWALATADAMTTDGEPVEVKNLNWGFVEEEWAEAIPEKYFLQCQQQMLVTGASRCLFGALVKGSRLVWEWVPRDEVAIRRIIQAGSDFWGHVERGECPPSDGHPHARKTLAKLATDDESIELYEGEIGPVLAAYEAAEIAHDKAADAAKKAKRQLEATRDEVAKLLGDHRQGFTSSGYQFRWKTTERRGYSVAPVTIHQFEIKQPKGT